MDMKKLEGYAKKLKIRRTYSEHLFIEALEKNKVRHYKFQQVIAPYIVDFYFPDKKLIVEIDGDFHIGNAKQENYDTDRDKFIMSLGLVIWRITNKDVFLKRNKIAMSLKKYSARKIFGVRTERRLTMNNNNFIEGYLERKLRGVFAYFLSKNIYGIITEKYINAPPGISPFKKPYPLKGGLEHF